MDEHAEHRSASCVVFRAVDELAQDEDGGRPVALKLMAFSSQFLLEARSRQLGMDEEYMVPTLETYPDINAPGFDEETLVDHSLNDEVMKDRVLSKEAAERLFCVVMPWGDRNLYVAIKHERFAGEDMDEVKHFTYCCSPTHQPLFFLFFFPFFWGGLIHFFIH